MIGSLWAASEILLGSFLKNAHVPLAGVILTGIGISILVAGHRLWPEKGLLWRAGLVCAAMKSVSPSAILLSPMAAIFAEGLLAELGVRLLGGNAGGYLLAGGMAMSWGLFHKIGKLYIFYGPEAVDVYSRGLEKIRAWMGRPGGIWEPLILLLAGYFLAGTAAALIGMRAAGKGDTLPSRGREGNFFRGREGAGGPGYRSVWHLSLHLLVLVGLMSSGRLPLYVSAALSAGYGLICAISYGRSAALLGRAGMWGGIAAASLLAGWLLGDWGAGLRMASRAFALTMGFAAVAQELMNPRVRGALERAGGKDFFDTLEYSFASLPLVLAALPSGKDMLLRPAASLRTVISQAPCMLDRARRPVFIVTGGHGSGKSTMVKRLAELMVSGGVNPSGIMAEGSWKDGVRSGFDLVDLRTGKKTALCRREDGGRVRAGAFRFSEDGLAAGAAALSAEASASADAVFLDEVGFLEIEGGGWAPQVLGLLGSSGPPVVMVIRDYLLEKALERWRIKPSAVWEAGKDSPEEAFRRLRTALEKLR